MVNLSTLGNTVSSAIQGETGTSYFTGVNDALDKVGGILQSPAHHSAKAMKTAANSLFIHDQIDEVALQTAFPNDYQDIWGAMQEVQDLSDAFTNCGDFALDAVLGAQTDFIKNSGIQQAGRDLATAIGGFEAEIDCVAGFATLFDGAGVIDDALGMGDLGQIQRRARIMISDATNPAMLANMVSNADIVRELVSDFNGMCQDMMGGLNALIQKDIDAMQAALNKLSQWAAFAKLATGDPCALVNNDRMLEHIAEPVMDDIVKLYNKVTGQSASPSNPIIPLGKFLGVPTGGIPTVPKLKQAAAQGLQNFTSVANSIPTGTELVDTAYTTTAMDYINGVGWVLPEDAQTDFTKEVISGTTRFSNSKDHFIQNAKDKAYEVTNMATNAVAKVHKVGWCSGGTKDTDKNRNKPHCLATEGTWNTKEMTSNEVKVAGSIEAAMGAVGKTLDDAFSSIVGDPPPSSPSSALAGGPPAVVSKARQGFAPPNPGGGAGAPIPPSPAAEAASSPDPNDPTPFAPLDTASFFNTALIPGRALVTTGAKVASAFTEQLSNIGGDISEYHKSMEVVEEAMKTGDWSQVETCTCQPKQAIAGTVEIGSCDFTGLGFPDGYKLIEKSFYTDELMAKVTQAEASGSKEYVMGDDGEIYQSAEVVVIQQYGATKVDPFLPGKEACLKFSGRWLASQEEVSGSSGGTGSFDIENAKSKAVCENANGSWICKQGQPNSTAGNKAVESFGKFTNKKNVNVKSKLPTSKAFDTDKLPNINF
jgi:hypothetical protein